MKLKYKIINSILLSFSAMFCFQPCCAADYSFDFSEDGDDNSNLVNDYNGFEFFSDENIKKIETRNKEENKSAREDGLYILKNKPLKEKVDYSSINKKVFDGRGFYYIGKDKETHGVKRNTIVIGLIILFLFTIIVYYLFYNRKTRREIDDTDNLETKWKLYRH